MGDVRFDEIIKTLEKHFPVQVWSEGYSPFEVLLAVILSQATERRNSTRAFETWAL